MATGVAESDGNIFEKLKRADLKELEQKQQAINERIHSTFNQSQLRLAELIDQNSTLPTTISSVTILGAPNTRRGFLKTIIDPLLSANRDRPYTQAEVVKEVAATAAKLERFGIYQPPISVFFDKPSQTDASTTPTDVAVFYSVKERGKLSLTTGTDVGNAEGSAYAHGQWRNILGGAETLDLNASLGTRTRSAYQATFDSPILSNSDFRFQFGGVQSSTEKIYASHEEVLKGAWTKLRWLTGVDTTHELAYNGFWRQLTGFAQKASPTVRKDAGDSFKNSFSYTWTTDRRNNSILPTNGYFLKTQAELAGWGPLQGDVAFLKTEAETQQAVSITLPGIKGDSGVSFSTSLRAGMLYPLVLTTNRNPELSRINDRFQLGGPTDVRGFRLSGLGPHDGEDAVGGDVYAAGSANLFLPLPWLGPEKPLRFQAFINGGRLLALRHPDKEGALTGNEVRECMKDTVSEVFNGLPSTSAGVGLVYAHPVARFELNFSLPLVLRKGEEGRKGFQFGIGINFL